MMNTVTLNVRDEDLARTGLLQLQDQQVQGAIVAPTREGVRFDCYQTSDRGPGLVPGVLIVGGSARADSVHAVGATPSTFTDASVSGQLTLGTGGVIDAQTGDLFMAGTVRATRVRCAGLSCDGPLDIRAINVADALSLAGDLHVAGNVSLNDRFALRSDTVKTRALLIDKLGSANAVRIGAGPAGLGIDADMTVAGEVNARALTTTDVRTQNVWADRVLCPALSGPDPFPAESADDAALVAREAYLAHAIGLAGIAPDRLPPETQALFMGADPDAIAAGAVNQTAIACAGLAGAGRALAALEALRTERLSTRALEAREDIKAAALSVSSATCDSLECTAAARVDGPAILGGTLDVGGAASFAREIQAQDLCVGGMTVLGGAVSAAANVHIGGALAVGGDVRATGSAQISGGLSVHGALAVGETIAMDAASGAVDVAGTLSAAEISCQMLTCHGPWSAQSIDVRNHLGIGGNATVQGRVETGALSVASGASLGSLDVAGNASVAGGTVRFGNEQGLDVQGRESTLFVWGNVYADGPVTCGATLQAVGGVLTPCAAAAAADGSPPKDVNAAVRAVQAAYDARGVGLDGYAVDALPTRAVVSIAAAGGSQETAAATWVNEGVMARAAVAAAGCALHRLDTMAAQGLNVPSVACEGTVNAGSLGVEANLHCGADAQVQGDVVVRGHALFGGTVQTAGTLRAKGGAVVSEELRVEGTTTLIGCVRATSVQTASLCADTASVPGTLAAKDLSVANSLTVAHLASTRTLAVGDSLEVEGPLTAGGPCLLQGDAAVVGTLTVAGPVRLERDAEVTGTLTVSRGGVTVQGGPLCADSLVCTGEATCAGELAAQSVRATEARATRASVDCLDCAAGTVASLDVPGSLRANVARIDTAEIKSVRASTLELAHGLDVSGTVRATRICAETVEALCDLQPAALCTARVTTEMLQANCARVAGALRVDGSSQVTGMLEAETAAFGGACAVAGGLAVGGGATIASNLSVAGAVRTDTVLSAPAIECTGLVQATSLTCASAVDTSELSAANATINGALRCGDSVCVANGVVDAARVEAATGSFGTTHVHKLLTVGTAGTAGTTAGPDSRAGIITLAEDGQLGAGTVTAQSVTVHGDLFAQRVVAEDVACTNSLTVSVLSASHMVSSGSMCARSMIAASVTADSLTATTIDANGVASFRQAVMQKAAAETLDAHRASLQCLEAGSAHANSLHVAEGATVTGELGVGGLITCGHGLSVAGGDIRAEASEVLVDTVTARHARITGSLTVPDAECETMRVPGHLDCGDRVTITGTLVTRCAEVSDGLAMGGQLTVGGPLECSGNASIEGHLDARGPMCAPAALVGTLGVQDVLSVGGSAEEGQGAIVANAATGDLDVRGTVRANALECGSLHMTGAWSVAGMDVRKDLGIGGNAEVFGAVTVQGGFWAPDVRAHSVHLDSLHASATAPAGGLTVHSEQSTFDGHVSVARSLGAAALDVQGDIRCGGTVWTPGRQAAVAGETQAAIATLRKAYAENAIGLEGYVSQALPAQAVLARPDTSTDSGIMSQPTLVNETLMARAAAAAAGHALERLDELQDVGIDAQRVHIHGDAAARADVRQGWGLWCDTTSGNVSCYGRHRSVTATEDTMSVAPPGTQDHIGGGSAFFAGKVLASEFVAYSDARLKHNIVKMDTRSCLEMVDAMHTFSYTQAGEAKYGFVAQQLATAVPNAVRHGPGMIGSKFHSDVLSIDAHQVIALLAGAVRDLSARYSALEAQVTGRPAAAPAATVTNRCWPKKGGGSTNNNI